MSDEPTQPGQPPGWGASPSPPAPPPQPQWVAPPPPAPRNSAGSNITHRIQAAWDNTFDPAKTCEVTYEVRGGEDGPAIDTLTVTGDEYERQQEEYVSTTSVGPRLTARVTAVEEVHWWFGS